MFTGLVQDIGTIDRIVPGPVSEVWVRSNLLGRQLEAGESIAIDGACLTVVERKESSFKVEATRETLRRTTIGLLSSNSDVNLECAMRLNERLGGHLVLGHVDGVSEILEVKREGGTVILAISLPGAMAPFFVEKGSVAVDGVSLTVNSVSETSFSLALIPETQQRTTLGRKKAGAKVNIETDLIGKYVARLFELRSQASAKQVTEEDVRRLGFGS